MNLIWMRCRIPLLVEYNVFIDIKKFVNKQKKQLSLLHVLLYFIEEENLLTPSETVCEMLNGEIFRK